MEVIAPPTAGAPLSISDAPAVAPVITDAEAPAAAGTPDALVGWRSWATPSNIRLAIIIVTVIVIIAIIANSFNTFLESPIGKGLGDVLGLPAQIVTWLASLPAWAIVSLFAVAIGGFAAYKIADRNAQNEFVEKVLDVKKATENTKDQGKELTKKDLDLATKEVIARSYEVAQIDSAAASGNSEAANLAVKSATERRASVAAEIGTQPPADQRKIADESKRIEEDVKKRKAERARAEHERAR